MPGRAILSDRQKIEMREHSGLLTPSKSAQANYLTSGLTNAFTAAESHVDALEELPSQKYQKPCLSCLMGGLAKAFPLYWYMRCERNCCETAN
jgi:hypothetical protein